MNARVVRNLLLAVGLLVAVSALAPSAVAWNCDGDPLWWHTEYPTYQVCQEAHTWYGCLTRTGPCPQ